MNCKPGDTARIIFTPEFPENEGKLVHVNSATQLPGYWNCTILCAFTSTQSAFDSTKKINPPGTILFIADIIMRPIRDPGEDAVDETILRIGKPSNEEVTA